MDSLLPRNDDGGGGLFDLDGSSSAAAAADGNGGCVSMQHYPIGTKEEGGPPPLLVASTISPEMEDRRRCDTVNESISRNNRNRRQSSGNHQLPLATNTDESEAQLELGKKVAPTSVLAPMVTPMAAPRPRQQQGSATAAVASVSATRSSSGGVEVKEEPTPPILYSKHLKRQWAHLPLPT